MIRVSPLTQEILRKIDPEPCPYSMRGFAVLDDEEPVCAAGVIRVGAERFLVFEGDDLKAYRRQIIEGWALIKPLLNENTFTVQDMDVPTSEGFIRHLGFEHLKEDLWQWRG